MRAAVEDAADLEDGDDRLAEGERFRLDLGRVLAVAGPERVARGPACDDLAVAADAVQLIDGGEVAAEAAGDDVADAVDRLQAIRAARAADPRRRGGRGSEEQEREGDEKRASQRDSLGPPGAPSVSSPARNA
jgi:hypothetical protein